MAKNRRGGLETMDVPVTNAQTSPLPDAIGSDEQLGGPTVADEQRDELTVRLPLAEPVGYRTRHVDVQLTGRQQLGLARLFAGLHRARGQLANGRWVNSPGDAVRWLLDQIGS